MSSFPTMKWFPRFQAQTFFKNQWVKNCVASERGVRVFIRAKQIVFYFIRKISTMIKTNCFFIVIRKICTIKKWSVFVNLSFDNWQTCQLSNVQCTPIIVRLIITLFLRYVTRGGGKGVCRVDTYKLHPWFLVTALKIMKICT